MAAVYDQEMPARLIAHLPNGPAASFWLEDDRHCLIGRGRDCDIRIDHPSVSRQHLRLHVQNGQAALRDLGSKNGTQVDGERVGACALVTSHWLQLGEILCQFELFVAEQASLVRQRQQSRLDQSRTLGDQVAAAAQSARSLCVGR